MFGDYITSRRKGSRLVTRVPTTERIVLVIGKVKNGGTARVFLGKRKLGVVKFAGKQKFSQLRTFDLPRARKGKLARRRGEEQAGPDRGRRRGDHQEDRLT